ncbi:hypothetical protein CCM_08322 [Cordyceps militaris CM01]|uniref:Uncharacterized protein n=1 Tax=Cordyceps militaris (strain CM01) TaxID=983644 RepID=G3JTD2_CORMM|nr:uncharacterized protein CCM_08322 [Cordyceps militaris CM01]EGX88279.1 hypothetical protein CCM_08322 [Cordyceps militaris CM01]
MSRSLEDISKTLAVIQILTEHDIPCCCVGISALKLYGARRMRSTWEICVPADLVPLAEHLFRSDGAFASLEPKKPAPVSRIHAYSRFGTCGSNHEFVIVPDCDVHLDCRAVEITHSLRGLPYPSLKDFAQSCIDRRSHVELCDFVDGTNLSEEWGEENLDLNGMHDVRWVRNMQAKKDVCPRWWPTRPKQKREIWQSYVRTKEQRLDCSRPPSRYVTQYRHIGSKDPWTMLSDAS